MPNKRKYTNGKINFNVPESMHTKLKVFSAYNKIPMTSIIRAVVADWFDARPAPEKAEPEKSVTLSVDFATDYYTALDAKANADGIPVSALLRALLKQKLKDVEFKGDAS